MAVSGSVEFCFGELEGVHFDAGAKDVEVGDVEDVELCHDWFCVCSWWGVCDESDDFFLSSDEGL